MSGGVGGAVEVEAEVEAERVRDVMHPGVVSCHPDTTLREAAKRMTESGVRALVVVGGDCGLIGIVSQTDLVNATVANPQARDWGSLRVRDVMTPDVTTITPDALLQDAARLMVEQKIHRVVVVDRAEDPCRPVGVLSMGDIVRDLIRDEDA